MARIPQVTRTITTTKANVLCMDLVHQEPVNVDVVVPREYKDEDKLFKAVAKVIDNEKIKAVQITAYEVIETLYGMSEQKFIENAEVLEPRKQNTENK